MDRPLTAREVYLTKRRRGLLGQGGGECPTAVVATGNKNLEALGFTVSRDLFERLRSLPAEGVARFYGDIVRRTAYSAPRVRALAGRYNRL